MPIRRLLAAVLVLALEGAGMAAAPLRLTLDEAVLMAVTQGPATRGAAAAAAAARAAVEKAASERGIQVRLDSRLAWLSDVPSMQLSALSPAVEVGEHLTWSVSLGASKTLWSGGRIPALLRMADAAVRSADAAASRAVQAAAFAAERAFLLFVAAQEERGVALQTLAAAESHLRTATARYESGAAARFDVIRAEVQVEEARQTLIQRESAIGAALAVLLQAIGLGQGEIEAVPPDDAPKGNRTLPELIAEALVARPEMEAAIGQEEAAAALVAAAGAERMPVVTVGADYLVAEPDSLSQYDRLAVTAAVTVPVLDGGRARARKDEAVQLLAQARAARDGLRLQVESEVRQAWAKVESGRAQIAVAFKRIEQAGELLRLAGVRYEGGIGTATEVADAQATLAAGRLGLTRARAEARIAEAELRLAAGVPPSAAPAGAERP